MIGIAIAGLGAFWIFCHAQMARRGEPAVDRAFDVSVSIFLIALGVWMVIRSLAP